MNATSRKQLCALRRNARVQHDDSVYSTLSAILILEARRRNWYRFALRTFGSILGAVLFIWLFSSCEAIGGAADAVFCGAAAAVYTPIYKAEHAHDWDFNKPTPIPK